MKIDLEIVNTVLQTNEATKVNAHSILEEIIQRVEEAEAEKEPKPKPIKKQFAILVSDPEGVLQGKELVGWVLQHPEEGFDISDLPKNVVAAGINYRNDCTKGEPIRTVGETFLEARNKDFTETDIWRKHREPVAVLTTDNQLPEYNE